MMLIFASVPWIPPSELQLVPEDQVQETIIISAIGLTMAVVALVGARRYSIPMLALAVVWFLVRYGVVVYLATETESTDLPLDTSLMEWIIFQSVITCLWIYPFIFLIKEIKNGIMSYDTYPREEYSCCCVNLRRRYGG
jgi:hypothetical protein